jgi:hypothetical protein
MQGNLTVLFFLSTLMSLVDGVSLACLAGADEVEDHISKTLGRLGKSLRKWSPLQIMQGNLGFGFIRCSLIDLINTPSTINSGWLLGSNI